ncbi:hydroxymethylglutaryl-CoA reductase, degradative [Allofustis seminis]|uniref:hydroxymethylglutaryl-CoA reductase, degradative n=1 Tax=Allofustis seminis TaxID=166939 RepID=UPI00036E8B0F|nr:hydroxymethylglutaryl-CoA reductase, degradative [Allofustis seminis]
MKKEFLQQFYKKSHAEKLHALYEAEVISQKTYEYLESRSIHLEPSVADHMIENYLTNFEIPLGVALNYVINGQEYVLPMVTEEPSVIAAASHAGKIISQSGGFHTTFPKRLVVGQLAFFDVKDSAAASQVLMQHTEEIIQLANASHPSIVSRGGGAREVKVRILPADKTFATPELLVMHLHVDTLEAMGANIVNTMMEGIKIYVQQLIGAEALMGILSNYATEALVTATCTISPEYLARGQYSGEWVRDAIVKAGQFAAVDPYRAVTHNKGIMNGVTALVLASGNDTRAVEAGAHAYASRSGQYRALSVWTTNDAGQLVGQLTLPLTLGTLGGTINSHPTVQLCYEILGHPTAKQLAELAVSLGLGQNLSALLALVTEGIQKGHMSLQANSLALSVGASPEEVPAVVSLLKKEAHLDTEAAKRILNIVRQTSQAQRPHHTL